MVIRTCEPPVRPMRAAATPAPRARAGRDPFLLVGARPATIRFALERAVVRYAGPAPRAGEGRDRFLQVGARSATIRFAELAWKSGTGTGF